MMTFVLFVFLVMRFLGWSCRCGWRHWSSQHCISIDIALALNGVSSSCCDLLRSSSTTSGLLDKNLFSSVWIVNVFCHNSDSLLDSTLARSNLLFAVLAFLATSLASLLVLFLHSLYPLDNEEVGIGILAKSTLSILHKGIHDLQFWRWVGSITETLQ